MIPISKPWLGKEEKDAVAKVLDSGIIASGPKVKEFEAAFAAFNGTKHAIAVANGTVSLHASLHAAGLKKGDKVICPSFTFIASANSILYQGCIPVFADVKEDTFNIDPKHVEKLLKQDMFHRIKAIMVVHLYGQVCEMDEINALAKKYGLKVIEDAAQAHGAKYKGTLAGKFGDFASYSLYATKNMASGEGGMIVTDSDEGARQLRVLINHGSDRVYYHTQIGYNYRMTDLEAAIGIEQLKKLPSFNEARRKNAARLKEAISKYGWVTAPFEGPENYHIFHQFTIKVKAGLRDRFLKHLNDNGVGAKIFYPIPVHKQPFYVEAMKYRVTLPVTERLAQEVISLPVHPQLTDAELKHIEKAFADFKE